MLDAFPLPDSPTPSGWVLVAVADGRAGTLERVEWWQSPDGMPGPRGHHDGDIYRRTATPHHYVGPDGVPSGLRREGTRAHFAQWVQPMTWCVPVVAGQVAQELEPHGVGMCDECASDPAGPDGLCSACRYAFEDTTHARGRYVVTFNHPDAPVVTLHAVSASHALYVACLSVLGSRVLDQWETTDDGTVGDGITTAGMHVHARRVGDHMTPTGTDPLA